MDDLSFLDKVIRLSKTTHVAGGMVTRMIGENYFNIPIKDEEYAKLLLDTLGKLKGPLMKAAQFLCTIPDALPKEYEQLLMLQSQAPAMGVPFVKRRLVNELGADWQKHFSAFDLNACAAASLGQVHKATLLNGDTVAVKLQYPGMDGVMQSDLQQLKLFFSLYEHFASAIQTENIFKEIEEHLRIELDYTQERANMAFYEDFFKDNKAVLVPKSYPTLSTNRLLTMSWMTGDSILDPKFSPDKDNLGAILFESWYAPLYQKGVLHGDPHPGNYFISPNHQLILLDFGCVRRFDAAFLDGVKNLYHALQSNNQELAVHAYNQWGFTNLSKDLIDIITLWAKLLYDPLLDDRVRLIQEGKGGKESYKMAKAIHAKLRESGGIRPPKEFVFMDRAAVGIGSVLMRLQSKNNWHKMFEEWIGIPI